MSRSQDDAFWSSLWSSLACEVNAHERCAGTYAGPEGHEGRYRCCCLCHDDDPPAPYGRHDARRPEEPPC